MSIYFEKIYKILVIKANFSGKIPFRIQFSSGRRGQP